MDFMWKPPSMQWHTTLLRLPSALPWWSSQLCGDPAVSRAVLSRIHCFLWTHIGPPPLQLTNTAAVSSDDVDVDVDGNADVDGNVDVDGDVGGDDDDNDRDHNWTLCSSSSLQLTIPNPSCSRQWRFFTCKRISASMQCLNFAWG